MDNEILENDRYENMARDRAGKYQIVYRGGTKTRFEQNKIGKFWGGLEQAKAFAKAKDGILLRIDLKELGDLGIPFVDTGKEVVVQGTIPQNCLDVFVLGDS